MRSPPILAGFVLFDRYSFLHSVDHCLYFALFPLIIILSILRFTASISPLLFSSCSYYLTLFNMLKIYVIPFLKNTQHHMQSIIILFMFS